MFMACAQLKTRDSAVVRHNCKSAMLQYRYSMSPYTGRPLYETAESLFQIPDVSNTRTLYSGHTGTSYTGQFVLYPRFRCKGFGVYQTSGVRGPTVRSDFLYRTTGNKQTPIPAPRVSAYKGDKIALYTGVSYTNVFPITAVPDMFPILVLPISHRPKRQL